MTAIMQRRILPAVASVAVFLGLVTPGAAPAAAQSPARDLDEGCPPEVVPDSSFADEARFFPGIEPAIDCIAYYGVTEGYPDGEYKGNGAVSRAQMASFVARVLVAAGMQQPRELPDAFPDDGPAELPLIGPGTHRDINWLAQLRIVTGRDGKYFPWEVVRRDQLASFLNRTVGELTGSPLAPPAQDPFPADDCGVHESSVNALASAGIVVGRGDGRYDCRGGRAGSTFGVSRGSMALFLARTLDFLVEEPGLSLRAPRVRVALVADRVEQGRDVQGAVTSRVSDRQFAAATVDGCGIAGHALPDEDPAAAGVQALFPIPADQPPGECVLTFGVGLDDGTRELSTQAVLVVPSAGQTTVVLEDTVVPYGGFVSGIITSRRENLEIIAPVLGCGYGPGIFEGGRSYEVKAQGPSPSNLLVTLSLPSAQAPGRCVLTFTLYHFQVPGSVVETRTRTISVTPPPPTVAEGPELIDVEVSYKVGGGDSVRFVFDEPITDAVSAPSFCLYTTTAAEVCARSARRDPDRPWAALADYMTDEWGPFVGRDVTTAAVRFAAVRDLDGHANPEASAGLQPSVNLWTAAPDLEDIDFGPTDAPEGARVHFWFDEPAFIVDPSGYHLVSRDGTVHRAASVRPGGEAIRSPVHEAVFPGLSFEEHHSLKREVRGYLRAGTVSDQPQDPGRAGVEGHPNPQQTRHVTPSGGGQYFATSTPDLVALDVDRQAGVATFTFDEDLTAPASAAHFRIYGLDAVETRAVEVALSGPRSVTARFAGAAVATAVAGSVDEGAVRVDSRVNRVDGRFIPGFVAPGVTVAPDLLHVGRTVTDTSVQVVFVFDEPAVPTGTGLFVYAPGGSRTALPGCTRGSQPSQIVCSADRASALGGAMEAAGLAALVRGAVVHPNGIDQSHPDSRPF